MVGINHLLADSRQAVEAAVEVGPRLQWRWGCGLVEGKAIALGEDHDEECETRHGAGLARDVN